MKVRILLAQTACGRAIARVIDEDAQRYLLSDGTWWDVPADVRAGGQFEGCAYAIPDETAIDLSHADVYQNDAVAYHSPLPARGFEAIG